MILWEEEWLKPAWQICSKILITPVNKVCQKSWFKCIYYSLLYKEYRGQNNLHKKLKSWPCAAPVKSPDSHEISCVADPHSQWIRTEVSLHHKLASRWHRCDWPTVWSMGCRVQYCTRGGTFYTDHQNMLQCADSCFRDEGFALCYVQPTPHPNWPSVSLHKRIYFTSSLNLCNHQFIS